MRESVAVTALLRYMGDPRRAPPHVAAGDTLALRLDARVVVDAASRGTARARDMVAELSLTALALLQLPPLHFPLQWIPRADNGEADGASREVGLHDSQLADYDAICSRVGFRPRADLFASQGNARCQRFWTEQPTTAAEGIDGLSAPLIAFAYAFPPFALSRRFAAVLGRYAATSTPVMAILPSDVVRVDMPTWRGDVIPLPEPSILPPPFSHPCRSPLPLSLVFIRPSPPQAR